MRYIEWNTDDGYQAAFGADPPFYFHRLDDDLSATAETVKSPRQDGSTTYYTALDTRTINVTGAIVATGSGDWLAVAELDRLRSELAMLFAPNRWGTLIYHTNDLSKQVRCRPIAKPTFGAPMGYTCTFDVELVTDSPFWETAEEYAITVGQVYKRWHFPWVLSPWVLGSLTPTGRLHNPTREIIYPRIEVESTSELVTVENQTSGKRISITRPIEAHQKMVIYGQDASAFIYERSSAGWREVEDVSHWLTLDSEPWGLVPGENVVAIQNEVPERAPLTHIFYRVPFLGV